MVLRSFAAGDVSLMLDCESCRLRADMLCPVLSRYAAIFERCSKDGRTCAMYSELLPQERLRDAKSLAWKAGFIKKLASGL